MSENIESLQNLINAFTLIPGIGKKTAERYAYSIVDMSEINAKILANSIVDCKQNIKFCSICGGFSDEDVCSICKSRDGKIICVVKDPKDIKVIEKAKNFKCNYHVLHGTLNPMENKGPNDIRIKELLSRLEGVEEVIIATNPDVEGEVTATYIAKLLKPLDIKVTRIAQGIQMGTDIQYADEVSLSRAIEDRKKI